MWSGVARSAAGHRPGRTPHGSRGHSSAGRALAWHARGRRFDPAWLHQPSSPQTHFVATSTLRRHKHTSLPQAHFAATRMAWVMCGAARRAKTDPIQQTIVPTIAASRSCPLHVGFKTQMPDTRPGKVTPFLERLSAGTTHQGGHRRPQIPLKRGGRFSTKLATPSRKSSPASAIAMFRLASMVASARVWNGTS